MGAAGIGSGQAGIGRGGSSSSAGNIKIGNSVTINATVRAANSVAVGAGSGGSVGTIDYPIDIDVPDVSIPDVDEPNNGYTKTADTTTTNATEFNPLKIHHGTKANQAINFYINDMHTKSLGTEKLLDEYGMPKNESDLARYDALSYDEDLQSAWLETLKKASGKTIDDIDVKTKYNANIAVRVLDGAIDYALNESTRLGAYLQRLEYTDANVTTMGENVQAAESTIRDSDMAKEMTNYTKANVLVQSAQSMLAQANQNSSAVLSLLQ